MTQVIKDIQCDSWSSINWVKCHRVVNNLQRRIFVAKQEGRFRHMRKLQNLLLSSQANRCLAVKQVSLPNTGRCSADINPGVFLTPSTRIQLIYELSQIDLKQWLPEQTKRVYISKSNSKKRPLGFSTLKDRALQVMVKSALEPEWKAVFESTCYGFSPGYSLHDALSIISNSLGGKKYRSTRKNWILNADIEGFFNTVCQENILRKLENFPGKLLIGKWLKAGYIEKPGFHVSNFGTPHEDMINLLLANIVLHDMKIGLNIKHNAWGRVTSPATLIRYANMFIVACRTKDEVLITMRKLNDWLGLRGLMLSSQKTKILHITQGFDFLGFNIRMYHFPKSNKHKLLIKPSKASVVQLRKKLKTIWKHVLGSTVSTVISRLNPIIKKWAEYYSIGVCSKTYASLDRYMWIRQYRYVKRTHPNKSSKWWKEKYWGQLCLNRKDKWVFGCKDTGKYMRKFAWTYDVT